jgi:hypothetical protein
VQKLFQPHLYCSSVGEGVAGTGAFGFVGGNAFFWTGQGERGGEEEGEESEEVEGSIHDE